MFTFFASVLCKQSAMPPQTHETVDYSKWDHFDDDDDLPLRTGPASSTTLAKLQSNGQPIVTERQRMANHEESLRLIAEWVKQAYPRIPADNVTQLIRFITLQHRGIHPDNARRAAEITAFLETRDAALGSELETRKEDDLLHALLALGHLCSQKASLADGSVDDNEKAKANGVLTVVHGALNTLWAARVEGGARRLFDQLLKEPEGTLAKRYRALEFALDCVRNPPEDPRDRPPAELTWMTKLGRAVFMQVAIGLLCSLILVMAMATVAFFDPEGKVFRGPLAQMLLRPEGAGTAGEAVGGGASDQWQALEWNGGKGPLQPGDSLEH